MCCVPDVQLVLIDGRSGAGKTDLARRLGLLWDAPIVHLDDAYPGWDGLVAGRDAIISGVVVPLSMGKPGSYRRWDWSTGAFAETVSVPTAPIVIVEGCGIACRATAELADVILWVECADDVRRYRAIERDGSTTELNFERWARQEQAVIDAEHPRAIADHTVYTDEREDEVEGAAWVIGGTEKGPTEVGP